MDIISIITGNPLLLSAVLGPVIKMATDQLKKVFANVDAQGVPAGYKVPVQAMVVVCTALATLGTLALKGQLATFDMSTLVNFLSVSLPALVTAIMTHVATKAIMQKTLGRPTLFKKD